MREAPPPPVKEDAPAKGPGRGSLTEVEGRATGGCGGVLGCGLGFRVHGLGFLPAPVLPPGCCEL